MVEPLLVIGGIAAGIYAAISGKKEPVPSTAALTKAAVPLAAEQVKAGVPVGVAIQAAGTAVIDAMVDKITKANICVITYAGGLLGTRQAGRQVLPPEVVKKLVDSGWKQVISRDSYICPPGRFL